MGSYINSINGSYIGTSAREKVTALLNAGAQPFLEKGDEFVQMPNKYEENMVCVVDNGHFAAAGYAFDERQFETFKPKGTDDRPRYWFIFDKAKDFADPKYWETNGKS